MTENGDAYAVQLVLHEQLLGDFGWLAEFLYRHYRLSEALAKVRWISHLNSVSP